MSADHITDPAPLPPVDPKMMASMVPDERIMERSAEAARALKEAFEIRERK